VKTIHTKDGSNDECYPDTETSRLLIANYFRQTILTTKQVFSNKPSANRLVTMTRATIDLEPKIRTVEENVILLTNKKTIVFCLHD